MIPTLPVETASIQKLMDTPVVACVFSILKNEDRAHCVVEMGANTSPLKGLTVVNVV